MYKNILWQAVMLINTISRGMARRRVLRVDSLVVEFQWDLRGLCG